MEEKSIWRQKSGRAINIACPLGTKVHGRLPAAPNHHHFITPKGAGDFSKCGTAVCRVDVINWGKFLAID